MAACGADRAACEHARDPERGGEIDGARGRAGGQLAAGVNGAVCAGLRRLLPPLRDPLRLVRPGCYTGYPALGRVGLMGWVDGLRWVGSGRVNGLG
eukprot:1193060-Prorocentrum_minimum.AAC.3